MRNLATIALLFIAFAAYSAMTEGASAQVVCPTPTPTTVPATPTPLIPTPTRTPSPQPTATPSGGYLFQDEFNSIDTSKWAVLDRFGDASNNERECYRPSQASIVTGYLVITSDTDATCSGGYKSAMLQWQTFNFLYGHIDVRAINDSAGGQWPAIWLLGTNCQAGNITSANPGAPCIWPQAGSDEIDIAEWLGGNMSSVNQQIHTSTSNFGCKPTTSTSAGNWHVYSLDWRPGVMKWLVDGVVTCTLTGSEVPSTAKFLMLNQAVGGTGGGTVNPAAFPAYMAIDYVRVSP